MGEGAAGSTWTDVTTCSNRKPDNGPRGSGSTAPRFWVVEREVAIGMLGRLPADRPGKAIPERSELLAGHDLEAHDGDLVPLSPVSSAACSRHAAMWVALPPAQNLVGSVHSKELAVTQRRFGHPIGVKDDGVILGESTVRSVKLPRRGSQPACRTRRPLDRAGLPKQARQGMACATHGELEGVAVRAKPLHTRGCRARNRRGRRRGAAGR